MTAAKELAVREGKPVALAWIDRALVLLRGAADDPLLVAALRVNFSFSFSSPENREKAPEVCAEIAERFASARAILERSDRFFVGVTEEAARRLFPAEHHADIPPAYAIFDEAVYFTPRFAPWEPATGRGFGPLCRAAMVLHESIHVIDAESGTPDVHISEWDEPGFSRQSVEESLHNPSAYASFAAQVHEGALAWPRDVRYGAGRPAD